MADPDPTDDRDRLVECVTCKKQFPFKQADIVGLGFRCIDCGVKADPEHDLAANLTPTAIASMRWSGLGMMILGLLAVLVGVAIVASSGNDRTTHRNAGLGGLIIAGFGSMAGGYNRLRA